MSPFRVGGPEVAAAGSTRHLMLGCLLLSAMLAIPSPAYPLDDVHGWRNTRWGMTQSEVRAAVESLGLSLTALPASYARALGADASFNTSVEIDRNYYDAIFLFPRGRGLERVVIRTLDFSREHALTLHASLLRTLTEQYGRPEGTDSRGSGASLTKWPFKTSTVVLSLYTDTAVPGNHVTQVAVVYAPTASATAPEDPQDKLMALGLLRALGEIGRGTR